MLPNIGLVGRAGSGKGVLAAQLAERGYEVVSFARPVKWGIDRFIYDYVHGADSWPNDEAVDEWARQHKEALRPAYQWFGTFCRDFIAPDYWIQIALSFVQSHNAQQRPVVIDDVRYPNEVAALKAAGFTTIRLDRPMWHRRHYGGVTLTGDQATHASEIDIHRLPTDHVLVNDLEGGHGLYCDLRRAMGWL